MDIEQRARILGDSVRLAQEGKTFKTRLSRCVLAMEHAAKLARYEAKGIPTIKPRPSVLVAQLEELRREIAGEEAGKLVSKAVAKAEVASTPRTRETALSGALIKVQELFDVAGEDGGQVVLDLKNRIHRVKLDGFLEAAKKAEFKGQEKKALDQYQEAHYFVLNDEIPDEDQRREIAEIEEAIARIEATQSP